jgi:hypothetical protein
MNLSNALSLLLQNEAKRPSRETASFDTTLADRNAENFPSNDTWWRTGALCIGMLNHNPSAATVMIIAGAKEDKRYAITTESTPVLVEFSTGDMKQVNMRLAKTSTERDIKLFVTTACANGLKRGTHIIPLRTEYVHHTFTNASQPRHPYELYNSLKNIKTPSVKMLQAWSKEAALKTNTDAIRSAVELNPTIVPQFEDKSAWQTFRDITDAFTVQDQDQDEFIDTLLESIIPLIRQEPDETVPSTNETTHPPTEPPPPPPARAETQQPQAPRAPAPPDLDLDKVEDVTPPGANRDIPHRPLVCPHSQVNHQQFDQRHHDDYREDQPNNYYDEQRNKRRPPSLSPTSEQPRG